MSDYQGNDIHSPNPGNQAPAQGPAQGSGQGTTWAQEAGSSNGPGLHGQAAPAGAGAADPGQGGDAGYADGYAHGFAQARAQFAAAGGQTSGGFSRQSGDVPYPPNAARYDNAGPYMGAPGDMGMHGGHAPGYGAGEAVNARPGLGEAMNEFAQGRGSVSTLTRALGIDDADFWKGALVGAAAALLLGSDSVRNAVFRNGKGQENTSE